MSAFWAHSGRGHFSCKFLYKVALVKSPNAFRLRRLAQSVCVCLRSGHVGLAMNFWSRITPLELALALVQVYFCPGWKKLPNMTVQVFIVAAQVCHYLRQPIHAICHCMCYIAYISADATAEYVISSLSSKSSHCTRKDSWMAGIMKFRKNVSMDARYRLSKQYFRAGIARNNPGGNHPKKYRRLFVAKML